LTGGFAVKILISSLKFSPGHLSHIIGYAKLFKEIGYEVTLWLHESYKKMMPEENFQVMWYPDFFPKNIDMLFLYNPSIVNRVVCKKLKQSGAKIIYLYHEPRRSFEQYLKEGLKRAEALKVSAVHYYLAKVLKYTDLVIVPSNYALKLYSKNDKKYNGNVVMIPLLFDDELTGGLNIPKKEYFSYIGHAVKVHTFDKYIELVKWIYTSGSNMKFEIATRTDIGKTINNDEAIQKMISTGILKLSYGKPLTNMEINEAYERSFCVWNVYRVSTQSGVLPKAFMFGTPVVASSVGSFPEFVRNGENGYLVNDYDFENIYQRLLLIRENISTMSMNCRNTFENTFYWKAQITKMKEVLESLL